MDIATKLAQQRTELAIERTHLAWVRTAFAFISASIAINRAIANGLVDDQSIPQDWKTVAIWGSLILCMVTTITLVAASIENLRRRKQIAYENIHYHARWPGVTLAILVIALGTAGSVLMILSIW